MQYTALPPTRKSPSIKETPSFSAKKPGVHLTLKIPFRKPPVFPYCIPAFVTFRFTDILRGYVAQPILQAAGYRLGFTEATVYQDRNVTILRVLTDEIRHLHAQRCMDISVESFKEKSVNENLFAAYDSLHRRYCTR